MLNRQSPVDAPAPSIQSKLAVYERIKKSTVPSDVMQRIELAKEVRDLSAKLVVEAEEARAQMIAALGVTEIPAARPGSLRAVS